MGQFSLLFLVLFFFGFGFGLVGVFLGLDLDCLCWESNLQIRCTVRGYLSEEMHCDRFSLANNWQMRFFGGGF